MLTQHGDWMPGADEQKPAADGTVEAWGRSRFRVYVPSVLEALGLCRGRAKRATTACARSALEALQDLLPEPVLEALVLAEVEHEARNNLARSA
jgi:hypothetical protein